MMEMKMDANVVQASRYDMTADGGSKGANLTVLNKPADQNPNRAGMDIMKIAAPYEVVDQLKDALPCQCEMVVEPVQGGGGKMSFKLLRITPKPQHGKS